MMKRAIFFIILLVFTGTSQADYNPNGFPLITATQGQVNGDVYVGGGHGVGNPPYTHNFNVPSYSNVEWARLYVAVYGATENYCAWIDTTYNTNVFPRINIGNLNATGVCKGYLDNNPNVYGGGHGKWWVYYDVTSLVQSGSNTVTITDSAGTGGFDGRIYGTVLVVVYSGGSNPRNITYWVNEGHEAFHYESSYYDVTTIVPEYNSNTTNFGALSGSILRADFTNVFLTADVNELDPFDFRFNDNPLVTSGTTDISICPSCFGDPSGYCPDYASYYPLCKLDGGGWCDDLGNYVWGEGNFFDIDIWNVTAYAGSSNYAYFHRDNDNFVSWMLSVLTAETSSGGANVAVTQNNVSFGNINKGGTAEIIASLNLTNTGDAPASIEAEFITSSGVTYGLINATNVIGGSNFSIGPNGNETALDNGDISTSISTLAPGDTVDYNAILYVPVAQVEGDYLGTVQITWS